MTEFHGFIGASYQAPSIYQGAEECINLYPEINPSLTPKQKGYATLYPTPGLLSKIQLPTVGEVRAMYVLPGGVNMLVVCGANVYLVAISYQVTLVGTLNSSSGNVSITDNRISAYIVDGSNRYTYTIATGVFATIAGSDGAFTGGDTCHYIDDFIIYNQPNGNQWAATAALSTVTSGLSFSSKDAGSDNIVALIADHRQVYLLGEYTTEVWVNAGLFPFPFQRIPGTTLQHGCAAKRSVTKLGESIAWLSQDTRGQGIVIMLAGYSPMRISTHALENDIRNGTINDAVAFTYQQEGHEFYVLSFPQQDKTWVYDLTTKLWHKRAYRDNLNILHRHLANCHALFGGLNLVGDATNGMIYALDSKTYTDNGQPILRLRRAPHITKDLNRVFYDSFQIQFQPGVGLVSGQGYDPKAMLRWSDDGGTSWSNSYLLPIGKMGQYKNRCIKRKMGWARDRVFEVSITDPINAVMVSAELTVEVGDS